jgi:hypothetical protein
MEDFSEGIDTNRLPQTDGLAGSTHTVALDDGGVATFSFLVGNRVAWSVTGEEWAG